MKVLIYITYAPAGVAGGIETSTSYMLKALESVGVETTTDIDDDYDLVDINMFTPGSKKAYKIARKRGIPVIMHGHSTLADYRHSFRLWPIVIEVFFKRVAYWLYHRVDRVIAVSTFVKHILEPDLVYRHIPIDVVPNALDANDFARNEKAIAAFRERFGIKPGEKVVINAGLPFERKGIREFFETARLLPDVKFIWFGTQPKFFTEHKILKAIKNRPSNVIMPGYMRNDVFRGALQGAACIFYPSYVETDGMVTYEAFASRTPLLVRDIAVNEYLRDGVDCFKGNDPIEFAAKLRYILSSDVSEVVENGYRIVTEKRNLETIGSALKAIYEKTLGKTK